MPRTGLRTSPELAIELVNVQSSYAPGDVIIGKITREEGLISPDVRVTVGLRGRAKSKLTVKGHDYTRIYRGRFNFFDAAGGDSTQTVFHGLVNIVSEERGGGGTRDWPFALTIPTRAAADAVAEENKESHSYLPLRKEEVEAQALPGVFFYQGSSFWSNKKLVGYVEYYLEAELIVTGAGGREKAKATATLPLFVRAPSTASPLKGEEFSLKKSLRPVLVRSYGLVPGMETAKLSLRQRAKTSFGSSKVPGLRFALQVGCPARIQLGTPIPFTVRVVLDREGTSDILRDVPQRYGLASLRLVLTSRTAVVCPGTLSSHDHSQEEEYDLGLDSVVAEFGEGGVPLPPGHGTKALDVGTSLQVLLEERQASALGVRRSADFKKRVYPCFQTYNVKHSHRLKWEVEVWVAGLRDVERVSGEEEVTVLGPSEEQVAQVMSELGEEGMKKNYDDLLVAAELGWGGALDLVGTALGG